jgi:hypothetical protein
MFQHPLSNPFSLPLCGGAWADLTERGTRQPVAGGARAELVVRGIERKARVMARGEGDIGLGNTT